MYAPNLNSILKVCQTLAKWGGEAKIIRDL